MTYDYYTRAVSAGEALLRGFLSRRGGAVIGSPDNVQEQEQRHGQTDGRISPDKNTPDHAEAETTNNLTAENIERPKGQQCCYTGHDRSRQGFIDAVIQQLRERHGFIFA